jgi:cell division septation protein DedD
VKRVNMPEIASYGGAGSAFDNVMGFLGKKASGASIPADVLNDMETLHGAISSNAQTKYQNKLGVINQNYGSSFQPVQMQNAASAKPSAPPPAAGFTRVQASDGSMHDIPSGNIAAAKKIDPNLKVIQ